MTLEDLPEWLRDYVEAIYDPEGDGHCGYRAVAVCLNKKEEDYLEVRKKLALEISKKKPWYEQYSGIIPDTDTVQDRILEEEEVPCPVESWMSMPMMVDAIANAGFRPVFFYSELQNMTVLPSFSAPNKTPPVTFAFIKHYKHFVALKMKPDIYPIPRLPSTRIKPIDNSAQGWKGKFDEDISLYQKIWDQKKGQGQDDGNILINCSFHFIFEIYLLVVVFWEFMINLFH